MNPQDVFCPNMDCPARGQAGKGNIHVHSQIDERWICDVCQRTFTTSKGTIFYRLRTDPQIVMRVIILLAYGCPVQAIVKAFGLDERTVRDWHGRAGSQCKQVHEHMVENSQQALQQVQADEIKVKTQKGTYWMALAMVVSTRLWLGGVVSRKRDLVLIQALADKIRGDCALPSFIAGGGWPVQLHHRFPTGFSQQTAALGWRNRSLQVGLLAEHCHCASRQAAGGRCADRGPTHCAR